MPDPGGKEADMPEKGERSIGELFSELTRELRTLFRQELALFAAEMKDKMAQVAKDTVAMVVGGVFIYSGFLVLLAALVIGVATFMPAWGAALLVGAVFLAMGTALMLKGGKDLTQMEKKPEQTTATVKETVQWAKTLTSRSGPPRRTRFANKSGIRKAI